MKIVASWDTRVFAIIPTITVEDFSSTGDHIHVVFRFGPLAITFMKKWEIEDAKKSFRDRMKDIENDIDP